jgi:signal transduction histidine kinase
VNEPFAKSPMISSLTEARVWQEPLSQFAKASGLTVTLYGPDRRPLIAHLPGQTFSLMLKKEGFFERAGGEHEAGLVAQAFATGAECSRDYSGTLPVFAFPLIEGSHVIGAVVAGWAFRAFPNPVDCARLARIANLPENQLWLSARENAPVGGEKLEAFLSLLRTWNASIISQLTSVKEAQEVSRLKDQFLATASHELRTPLTSILIRVQALKRHDGTLTEKARGSLEAVERAARIQSRLVDDLLETSRLMTGKLNLVREEFSPAILAQEAYETCLSAAECKGVRLSVRHFGALSRYVGDPMRMQQVFWNLVNNAIKFTPEGGEVKIRTKEDLGSFVFEVSDSGKGLSQEEMKHLFQPFYQAMAVKHGANAGLGLGLSIAKTIVDLHLGSIVVRSPGYGHGSTFVVTFPSAQETARPA